MQLSPTQNKTNEIQRIKSDIMKKVPLEKGDNQILNSFDENGFYDSEREQNNNENLLMNECEDDLIIIQSLIIERDLMNHPFFFLCLNLDRM